MRTALALASISLLALPPVVGQGTVVNATPVGGQQNIGPGVPTDPCSNPNEHHLGQAVTLIDSFLPPVISSGVHVDAVDGPAGEFGFFLLAQDATTPVAVSQGLLCLVLPIARFNASAAANTGNPAFDSLGQFDPAGSGVFFNLSGTASLANGLGYDVPVDLPPPFGPGQFQSGESWWLQLWYRDRDVNGNPESNFSSAIEIEIP